jgi:hypothetical protein
MSNPDNGSSYDATGFSGFTFAQAPKPAQFLDRTITQDSTHQSSQSANVSDFRRSTQRRQQLPTPSRPFAAFPVTPQTPSPHYGRETSHSRDSLLFSAESAISQTSQEDDIGRGDETSASQHHDRRTETPLSEAPFSSVPAESINSNAASAIQERLARMKQQHNTSRPQASSTRPFASISRSSNPPQNMLSSDLFLSPLAISQSKHVPLNRSETTSHTSSRGVSLVSPADSTVPKREVFDRQQDLDEEPVSPMSRSKSVIGHRSSSVENPPSRELPAMLAEALLSAETWNEENETMVRSPL